MPWKKKLLLTSENAAELDQKYTALTETAWIAKLAQMLVHLKFGWSMGEEGSIRRVSVISGGLTARVRRKYRLNQILYPELPEDTDPDDIKKNREDSRHHALDAMVISYIPNWARDKAKTSFLKFPEKIQKNAQGYFSKVLENVVPAYICREKPALEETFYAMRSIDNELKIVKRIDVYNMPFKGNAFNAQEGIKQAEKILEKSIKDSIIKFLSSSPAPDKDSWKNFLENYRTGSGARLIKAACLIGDPEEYKNLTKAANAGRGQFKRAKSHNGYFIYADQKGKPKVRPVYVFESQRKIREDLQKAGFKIHGFFYSNCLVQIDNDVDLGNRLIPKGKYICSTIMSNGFAKFKGSQDYLKSPISLQALLSAGFRRIDL